MERFSFGRQPAWRPHGDPETCAPPVRLPSVRQGILHRTQTVHLLGWQPAAGTGGALVVLLARIATAGKKGNDSVAWTADPAVRRALVEVYLAAAGTMQHAGGGVATTTPPADRPLCDNAFDGLLMCVAGDAELLARAAQCTHPAASVWCASVVLPHALRTRKPGRVERRSRLRDSTRSWRTWWPRGAASTTVAWQPRRCWNPHWAPETWTRLPSERTDFPTSFFRGPPPPPPQPSYGSLMCRRPAPHRGV